MATAAMIDARETYRQMAKIIAQTPNAQRNGTGRNASMAPELVATPLPPLNFNQHVQLWPAITKIQQVICNVVGSTLGNWNKRGAMYTGRKPFAASINNTARPGPFPSARITLVAPILPLPTLRISIPRALAQRKPVGMEPRK